MARIAPPRVMISPVPMRRSAHGGLRGYNYVYDVSTVVVVGLVAMLIIGYFSNKDKD